MTKAIRMLFKYMFLFVVMGGVYYCIEIVWRGQSHISMFILAGCCGIICGLLNELFPWELGLLWQSMIGATVITACEFVTGLIVNVWLDLGVWDYSTLPFNVLGQICLPFTILWAFISCAAIILDDYLRYWFFGEEKPHYNFIRKIK